MTQTLSVSAVCPPTPAPALSNTGGSSETIATSHARPHLKDVLARIGLSMLLACVIPGALFYGTLVWFHVWSAMAVALGWSYGTIAFRALTRRRVPGLLVLAVTIMTVRTTFALMTGSTFLYFLQPIINDGLVAAAFLLSLASARPVAARLAGDFYPMDGALERRPRIRRLLFRLTLMWALLFLGKAGMTLWLLHSQPLETFVLAKTVTVLAINGLAVVATVVSAVVVARKEGLLPATAQLEA